MIFDHSGVKYATLVCITFNQDLSGRTDTNKNKKESVDVGTGNNSLRVILVSISLLFFGAAFIGFEDLLVGLVVSCRSCALTRL